MNNEIVDYYCGHLTNTEGNDYILRTISNDKWMSYDRTHISDKITVNRYLQENFDLSLDELKEFIEKYEPERTI